MKKVTIKISEREFSAISSLIDLADQTISDAEWDYLNHTKGKRRNGGYSSDSRVGNKFLLKIFKAFEKVPEE